MQRDDMKQGRRPKNPVEAAFFDLAAEAGWHLTQRGWPSFFLQRGDAIICVQVEPPGRKNMRPESARLQGFLAALGVPCYRWSPDAGLAPVGEGGLGVGVELREDAVRALEELSVIPTSASTEGVVGGGSAQQALPGAEGESPSSPSRSETSRAIDRVWAAYVEAMNPRKKVAGDGERLIIRKALKEGTVEELILCIKACAASDYHMKRGRHSNREGGKYNALGKILTPRPRLGETQRSRIDWWLDRANSAGAPGIPSADSAIVNQRQIEVQRGYNSDDPEMVEKAEKAQAWLAEHGIETVRREDGYPVFRHRGAGGEQ